MSVMYSSPHIHLEKSGHTRWFKCDRDYLCVNKSQFVPVIFEPPCTSYLILTGNENAHSNEGQIK
jgi:hypothetical protein